MNPVRRRDLLIAALGAGAAASLPRAAFAQTADLSAVRLTDTLVLITGAGANVVAGVEPDGLTLIDGGLKQHSAQLLDFAARETGQAQVKRLFNTHWHPEQTGLNEILGARNVPIIAHENTRLWLTAKIEPPYEDRVYRPIPADGLPTETFYDRGAVPFAGGEARYSYALQAHTDGDMLVHFPEQNVIVAGGALKTDGWQYIDWWTGGWMGSGPARALNNVLIPTYGGMVGGLQTLLEMADDDTVIVPASGPVADKAEVQAQFEVYAAIADSLREMMYEALGPEEVLAAAPAAGMRPEWGSPDAFLVMAFKSMWPHLTPDA